MAKEPLPEHGGTVQWAGDWLEQKKEAVRDASSILGQVQLSNMDSHQ